MFPVADCKTIKNEEVGITIKQHGGSVKLQNDFVPVHKWLERQGEVKLTTKRKDTAFTARTEIAIRGIHSGKPVIIFSHKEKEYARAYECCWRCYYNCNRTRIGMYCKALDSAV